MRAYIIDDMELSRQSLTYTLKTYFPFIKIVGESGDFIESILDLQRTEVDILFLDINLGQGKNGFQILDRLNNFNGAIIIITAYDEHAVTAFRYNVSNFIMKPIDIIELSKAINLVSIDKTKNTGKPINIKPSSFNELKPAVAQIEKKRTLDKISFPFRNGLELVNIDDIIYIQANGSYAELILTNDRKYRVSKNLKFMLSRMAAYPQFIRVQKSYVVNKDCITGFIRSEGGMLELNGEIKIPVSIHYKKEILNLFP